MKKITRILAPIGIVGLGVLSAGVLMALSGGADRSAPPVEAPGVQVLTVAPGAATAVIRGTGVVEAEQQVTLTPQVSGEIVYVSPDLLPGGRFGEGEVLARVDSRDYQAALAQQEANLAQAELNYKLELGRQATAEREWELLGASLENRQLGDAEAELALRKPHLYSAERSLEAAQASAHQAGRNVGRTRLTAPFNAMVVAEGVDVGQVVSAASQVATLVGTDRFRVTVSVPVEDLAAVELPDAEGRGGSRATVTQRLGDGSALSRTGRALRIGGQLDPETRTAQVIVEIADPLEGAGLPLLPGAFVDVEIAGRELPAVTAVPREAVYEGARVWTVDDEGSLARREIVAGWRSDDQLYITDGLSAGDRVVVTPMSLPIEGAPVRVLSE